jgi:hypothetical protein
MPQSALPWSGFHVERIRARQHGGDENTENLALACQRCNLRKGPNLASIDPETGLLTPLSNPRLDAWSEHFELVAPRVVGLTNVGRATAVLPDMNDQDRIQLRAELAALGHEVE